MGCQNGCNGVPIGNAANICQIQILQNCGAGCDTDHPDGYTRLQVNAQGELEICSKIGGVCSCKTIDYIEDVFSNPSGAIIRHVSNQGTQVDIDVCALVQVNCSDSLVDLGGDVYRHTAVDGTQIDIDIPAIIGSEVAEDTFSNPATSVLRHVSNQGTQVDIDVCDLIAFCPLDQLSDVNAPAPTVDQVLIYDGAEWVADDLPEIFDNQTVPPTTSDAGRPGARWIIPAGTGGSTVDEIWILAYVDGANYIWTQVDGGSYIELTHSNTTSYPGLGVRTLWEFDTIAADTLGEVDGVAHTITIKRSGRYMMVGSFRWDAQTTPGDQTIRLMVLTVNGIGNSIKNIIARTDPDLTSFTEEKGTLIVDLAAGDVLRIALEQSTAGNEELVQSADNNYVQISRLMGV